MPFYINYPLLSSLNKHELFTSSFYSSYTNVSQTQAIHMEHCSLEKNDLNFP